MAAAAWVGVTKIKMNRFAEALTKSLISLEMSPMQKFEFSIFWYEAHSLEAVRILSWRISMWVSVCLAGTRKLGEAKSNISPQTTLMSNVPSLQYHYSLEASSLFTKLFKQQQNNLSPSHSCSDYPFWSMLVEKKGWFIGFCFFWWSSIGLKNCNWWTSLGAIRDLLIVLLLANGFTTFCFSLLYSRSRVFGCWGLILMGDQ